MNEITNWQNEQTNYPGKKVWVNKIHDYVELIDCESRLLLWGIGPRSGLESNTMAQIWKVKNWQYSGGIRLVKYPHGWEPDCCDLEFIEGSHADI